MKRLNWLFIFVIVILMTTGVNVFADSIKINSSNAVLYNVNDDIMLYQKNKDEKVSVASLTKMMTAIVAIENIDDLSKKISFEKSDYDKLISMNASGSSLDVKKKYTYEDLLYGLLLESGADCANALARLISGNEKAFVKLMNEKAKELGMNSTSFANPIGMDDKNNYSTMEDLAILFKSGLKNPTFKKIITSKEYKASDGTKLKHTIIYYEKLNKMNDITYILGGKTGYETDAGYALATIAYKNDALLMFITSGASNKGDHLKDAKKVYDYYFNNYSYQNVVNKGDLITTLNGEYLSKSSIEITADSDIKYYLKNNYNVEDIKLVYRGIDSVSLKNKYKDKIGTLNIYYKDKVIKTMPVYLNQKIYPDFKLIILAVIVYIFIIGCGIIIADRLRHKRLIDQL